MRLYNWQKDKWGVIMPTQSIRVKQIYLWKVRRLIVQDNENIEEKENIMSKYKNILK